MAASAIVGRVISNFAHQHLKTAILLHKQVAQIESSNANQEFGAFFEDVRSYSSASVFASAAAIEALINELYIDPSEKLRPMIPDFEKEFWEKGGIEMKPILTKYNHALQLLGKPPFEKDDELYICANSVIELRNSLVNFKPLWDSKRQRQIQLEEMIRGRFDLSPFPDSGADFISMKAMSSGCTKWSIISITNFISEFQNRANLGQKKLGKFIEEARKIFP